MATQPITNCCGFSYHLADVKAAVQSAYNCYPQRLEDTTMMMKSAPGRVLLTTLGGEIRASRCVNGIWYVVGGSVLYRVNETTGATVTLGSLSSTSGYVGIADNETQLVLVDGPNLYVLTIASNAFVQVVNDAFLGSEDVHELDGYMIFVDPGTEQFYLSAIDDSTMLDGLDFSSADSAPGAVMAHIVSHRQAWFFKTRSGEIWVDSGDTAFPFVRYNSYTLDVGCVGRRALISAADTIFWIGVTLRGTGLVYMASGNRPQRVSNLAVEEALAASTDLSKATMWTYQIDGHEFIAINAPGMSSTWVYDAALQQWHERAEWDAGWKPDRIRLVTFVNGSQFAGDADGNLYRLDDSANNLAGLPLVRERTWPHFVAPTLEPTCFRGVELSCKTGAGGVITLELSNDGGETFGPKLLRSLGAAGRWMQRIRWLGLGTAYNRVFRIRCSDDVPFAIYAATVVT